MRVTIVFLSALFFIFLYHDNGYSNSISTNVRERLKNTHPIVATADSPQHITTQQLADSYPPLNATASNTIDPLNQNTSMVFAILSGFIGFLSTCSCSIASHAAHMCAHRPMLQILAYVPSSIGIAGSAYLGWAALERKTKADIEALR